MNNTTNTYIKIYNSFNLYLDYALGNLHDLFFKKRMDI